MANRDSPMGLIPAYHAGGGVMRPSRYKIASAMAEAIFTGDLVHLTGTGKEINGGLAATDAPFIGVFAGCRYTATNGEIVYADNWVASTATLGSVAADAFVYDDPDIVFEIQSDGTTVAGDIGNKADIAYTAGSTTTGRSKTELDQSDVGTGANLYIVDFVERADNAHGGCHRIAVSLGLGSLNYGC
jgi:hypothetical protein